MICYPDRCRSRIHLFNRSLSGQYQAHKPQCCLSSRSRMWVNHRVNNAKQIWSVWDSSAGHDQAGHAPEEQFQLWERRGGRELAQGCHAPRPRRAGFRRLRPNPWFKIHVSPSTWEADRTLEGLSCQPQTSKEMDFPPCFGGGKRFQINRDHLFELWVQIEGSRHPRVLHRAWIIGSRVLGPSLASQPPGTRPSGISSGCGHSLSPLSCQLWLPLMSFQITSCLRG